jgi:hypothetical protein
MDEYDDEASDDRGPAFPVLVRVAGVIWILFGMLGLVGTLLQFAAIGAAKAAPGAGPGPAASTPCCGLLIALGFLAVGYQTVTGKAKDTLGNAIGSIGIGLLYYALIAVFALAMPPGGIPGPPDYLLYALFVGFGTLLVLAGGLALVGRPQYKAWRRAAGYGRPPRRADDDG